MKASGIPFSVYKALSLQGHGTFNVETLTGAKTLLLTDAQFQLLDAGGAGRAITLPTVGPTTKGLFFVIANKSDAAEDLTLNTNLQVVGQNEVGVVMSDGASWVSVGVFSVTLA